ncbi:MAG: Hsp70 family protein [Acidimicrobiales bacterium]
MGTTFTAAAIHRDGTAKIFPLSEQRIIAPTMVARDDDGRVVVGWQAARSLRDHPERVVHSFKRRIGDRTPIALGDKAYEPSWFIAQIIGAVVTEITRREGEAPSRIALTHPATWNAHKIARLLDAASAAGLTAEATVLLSEPEAAAMAHTTTTEIEAGALIAVYDLGGGSFDTAALRRSSTGYEIVGLPEGIERLGGLDFDEALYRYATDQMRRSLPPIDPADESTGRSLSQLHLDCVTAKETLSFEPSADLALSVGDRNATVTIERPSFEALVRPALMETIGALRRCLSTARVSADDVGEVLLTGGSSQIPLVAKLLSEETRRPVAVHPSPKELVAIGAAYAAARADDANGDDESSSSAKTIEPTSSQRSAPTPPLTTASTMTASNEPSNGNGDAGEIDLATVAVPSPVAPDTSMPAQSTAVGLSAATKPAPVAAGGAGRPPSLLPDVPLPELASSRIVGAVERTPDMARQGSPLLKGWSDGARQSLFIGIGGALGIVLIIVVFLVLRSILGTG